MTKVELFVDSFEAVSPSLFSPSSANRCSNGFETLHGRSTGCAQRRKPPRNAENEMSRCDFKKRRLELMCVFVMKETRQEVNDTLLHREINLLVQERPVARSTFSSTCPHFGIEMLKFVRLSFC